MANIPYIVSKIHCLISDTLTSIGIFFNLAQWRTWGIDFSLRCEFEAKLLIIIFRSLSCVAFETWLLSRSFCPKSIMASYGIKQNDGMYNMNRWTIWLKNNNSIFAFPIWLFISCHSTFHFECLQITSCKKFNTHNYHWEIGKSNSESAEKGFFPANFMILLKRKNRNGRSNFNFLHEMLFFMIFGGKFEGRPD